MKRDVRSVAILWAVITVVLVAASFLVPGILPSVASSDEHGVRMTMLVFSILSAPVIALVVAIAVYSLVAWRSRTPGPPTQDGEPIRDSTPVLTVWLGVSSVLVLFLLIWGFGELWAADAKAAPGAMVVNVTGQQWIWSFKYPDGVQSEQLVLPVGKPVVLQVTSEDVVHGFWIPNFGLKADANAGETTQFVVTPTTTGTFPIRCAELCGLYHAYMDTTVRVVSPSDFDAWLASGGTQGTTTTTTTG